VQSTEREEEGRRGERTAVEGVERGESEGGRKGKVKSRPILVNSIKNLRKI
jgi:hypothetical protein